MKMKMKRKSERDEKFNRKTEKDQTRHIYPHGGIDTGAGEPNMQSVGDNQIYGRKSGRLRKYVMADNGGDRTYSMVEKQQLYRRGDKSGQCFK